MPIRDLTDDEFERAKFLSRKILKIDPRSVFALSCGDLAHSKQLTRGQFEALERAVDTARPSKGGGAPSYRGYRSRKPITLAGPTGTKRA
jgi:hypothetical protein